jgi:hypothetical protein
MYMACSEGIFSEAKKTFNESEKRTSGLDVHCVHVDGIFQRMAGKQHN